MTERVKARRSYRSGVRSERAAASRAAVIVAARTLFIARGWAATTIAGVARAAGVSQETVYAMFGSKGALFAEVVRAAVRRSDPQTPLLEQAGPRAVAAAQDQRTVLRLFSTDIAGVLSQVAALMAVARGVAGSEPEIATIYRGIHEGRRNNLALVSAALGRNGPLKPGLSEADATGIIWRLASPELFLLITGIEGLDTLQYARWLEETLATLLLP